MIIGSKFIPVQFVKNKIKIDSTNISFISGKYALSKQVPKTIQDVFIAIIDIKDNFEYKLFNSNLGVSFPPTINFRILQVEEGKLKLYLKIFDFIYNCNQIRAHNYTFQDRLYQLVTLINNSKEEDEMIIFLKGYLAYFCNHCKNNLILSLSNFHYFKENFSASHLREISEQIFNLILSKNKFQNRKIIVLGSNKSKEFKRFDEILLGNYSNFISKIDYYSDFENFSFNSSIDYYILICGHGSQSKPIIEIIKNKKGHIIEVPIDNLIIKLNKNKNIKNISLLSCFSNDINPINLKNGMQIIKYNSEIYVDGIVLFGSNYIHEVFNLEKVEDIYLSIKYYLMLFELDVSEDLILV